jgi:hypothetical protein
MAGRDKEQVREPIGEGAGADQEIRRRAYEISQSDDSGTPEENWHRAEREIEQRDDTATTRT